jgi:hypothetical protein
MFPPKNLSHTYLLDHLQYMNDLFKMTIYSL